MKRIVFPALFLLATAIASGQVRFRSIVEEQVKWLFPDSTSFSVKGWTPPHIKVYKGDPARPESLEGFVFWTQDLAPKERGYDGPIEVLVGMDTKGTLSGIIVLRHHEPYGNFSVDTEGFANQFEGKRIQEPFRVGSDVDAVSRATISVTSATRAIKNSARRMATQFLSPPGL